MPDRCDTADGKPCDGTDERGICPFQRFACNRFGLCRIDLVATGCQEQDDRSAVRSFEYDRFGDLVDIAIRFARCFLSGARLAWHFQHCVIKACIAKRRPHTFQTFAHAAFLTAICGRCNDLTM